MRRSPQHRYTVHGQTTTASAQPGPPSPCSASSAGGTGASAGTIPSDDCASVRSTSHFAKNPATSKLNAAVRANNCALPAQPSRSSRYRQSIGTSRKLPRCVQWMLLCNRFSNAMIALEITGLGSAAPSTTPFTASIADSSKRPPTSTN